MSTLQIVGTVVGAFFGPVGAFYGFEVGSIANAIFNPPHTEGPRLDELRVQTASYGSAIPFEWGTDRHAGTVIWPKQLTLKEASHDQSTKGGSDATTYSYSASFAVLMCEGPIAGVRRIWANKRIIYDVSTNNTSGVQKDPSINGLRFHLGTADQEPDPLIEATDGPSPAYLGYAYVVFEDLQLADYGNRLPQLEFEVITNGGGGWEPVQHLVPAAWPDEQGFAVQDPNTGYIWADAASPDGNPTVIVVDPETATIVQTITLPGSGSPSTLAYDTARRQVWIGNSNDGNAAGWVVSAIDYTAAGSFTAGGFYSHGTIVYVDATDEIWCFPQGSTTFNPYVRIMSAITYLQTGGFYYAGMSAQGYTKAALYLPDRAWVVVVRGNAVYILDALSRSVLHTLLYDVGINSQNMRAFYDQKHARLYIYGQFGPASYLDLDSLSFTAIGIQALTGVYNPADDTVYIGQINSMAGHDPITLEQTGVIPTVTSSYTGPMFATPSGDKLIAVSMGAIDIIPLRSRLAPSKIQLSQIVRDICVRAGMTDADLDVSQLTDLVDGYIVPRQMTARAAIEPLQVAFFFDAVESDDKLKFIKRGQGAVATIPVEDRAAHDYGADLPDSLTIVRAQDLELPVEVDVEYADIDADHLIGTQYTRRLTKDTKQKVSIQTPVVMTATKAKQVADVNLYDAWQTQTYKWTTGRKWAHLEPTDVVNLPTAAATYTARITAKREQPGGVIEWEGKQDGVEVYTSTGAGAVSTNYVSQSLSAPGATELQLLDIPLLRDQDANKGFYVAMDGTTANWPGAQLFKSTDGGSTYGSVLTLTTAAVIGTATNALGNFSGDIFDNGNTVTVKVAAGDTLSNYTADQLLSGASAFALGADGRWEIVQYLNATLTAPNTYTLSGLLRGRKGTEWATGTHAAGDTFVLLAGPGIGLYDPGSADIGVSRKYKAPTLKQALSDAQAVTFTDHLVRKRPYSVANLQIAATGDGWLVSWAHRSIVGSGWTDGGDVPLDPTFVAFDVTFEKIDGTPVKTYSTASESFAYHAGELAADFGDVPAAFKVRVAQRNSDYGQGVGVTIASNNATLVYDVPAPLTNPGTAPGGSTPGTGTGGSTGGGTGGTGGTGGGTGGTGSNTDVWHFDSWNSYFDQYSGLYGVRLYADANYVAYFGGYNVSTFNYSAGMQQSSANPYCYLWNRSTKALTRFTLDDVYGSVSFTGGQLGTKLIYIDGAIHDVSTRTTRTLYTYDFTDPTAPVRTISTSANAFQVGNAALIAAKFYDYNGAAFVGNKLYFPFSQSVYDTDTNTWGTMSAPPTACWYRALLGAIGNTLYLLGGTTTIGDPIWENNPGPVQNQPFDQPYKKEVWALDTTTGTWTRKADLPYAMAAGMITNRTPNDPNFQKRMFVFPVNGKLYLFDSFGSIFVYDPVADTWTTKSNAVAYDMILTSAQPYGGVVWMATGIGINKPYGISKAKADLGSPGTLENRMLFHFNPANL